MLTHLQIRDFAIIERIELEFDQGLTVLTGETGAGKSILLDALGLVLGDRADSAQVRSGAERADITAAFSIDDNAPAQLWLHENELDTGECILRRTVSSDGRSRGYINGQVATAQSMRTLGEHLVDIHGQHEHQQLLRKTVQRSLLDSYAENAGRLREIAEVFSQLRRVESRLEEISAGGDISGQIDMLQFQIAELDTLDLKPETIAAQNLEYTRLSNAGELITACQDILASLYEDDGSIQARLATSVAQLERLSEIDTSLSDVHRGLNEAAIQCSEAASELRSYLTAVEIDERRLSELEDISQTLFSLSRKHRTQPEALNSTLQTLQGQYAELTSAGADLTRLKRNNRRCSSVTTTLTHN